MIATSGILYALSLTVLTTVPLPKPRLNIGKIPPGDRGHSLQRFREIKEFKNVDVLCIGSSTCYRGFDPRIFNKNGLSCFNMGSINQTPLNTYYLLQEFLDSLNPRHIIFDISIGTLNNTDGLEGFADLAVNLPFSGNLVKMGFATGNIYALNTLAKEYFLASRLTPYSGKIQNKIENETYISGGYVETSLQQSMDLSKLPPVKLRFSEEQKKYLGKIIEMAQERNITLTIVTQPMPWEATQKTSGYSQITGELAEIARKYNIIYINYNDEMKLNSQTDFFDEYHLNASGVKKYNNRLISDIFY